MTYRRSRFPVKVIAAMLSVACVLAFEIAAVSPVIAAEPSAPPKWETYPPRVVTPPSSPFAVPPAGTAAGPAAAGEAAGAKTSAGVTAGTWGWIAGGVAAVALIAVAAGGGGGGDSGGSTPVCNQ